MSIRQRRYGGHMKHCCVFPGQGTQFTGMGKELFPHFPKIVAIADEVLGYSIQALCLGESEFDIKRTEYAQPAILIVSYLTWLKDQSEFSREPDYLIGHSLGEYTALLISGAFDVSTALKLVKVRGRLMSQASNGGMAAVMNINASKLEMLIKSLGLSLEISNYNTPVQTVVSGSYDGIVSLQNAIKGSDGYCVPLPVSGAFHSQAMFNASVEFEKCLEGVHFNSLNIPVISNVTAKPFADHEIKDLLCKQIYSPVQWMQSINSIESENDVRYYEFGPKSILIPMIDSIKKSLPIKNDNTIVQRKKRFGSLNFRETFNLKEALMAGAMYRGISSPKLVIAMAKAGYLASLGTGGLSIDEIATLIDKVHSSLLNGESFAVNLLAEYSGSGREMNTINLLLRKGVTIIEAAAFVDVSPALSLFKIKGLEEIDDRVICKHKIIAKVSHHIVAEKFLSPIPQDIISHLLNDGLISEKEAEMAQGLIVADALTVEADSGGHTDQKAASTLFPALKYIRDNKAKQVYVGLAGGIGTPESVLSAFVMGADYVVTGSINQATVEAGQSNEVKSLLAQITINDTAYAPAGDMFEIGALVQVVKKQTLFPMRARKLYELYKQYSSLDDIPYDEKIRIEKDYFKSSIGDQLKKLQSNMSEKNYNACISDSQKKMALLFRDYFTYASNQAISGGNDKANYQIHCGSIMGAFNEWVKGSKYERWQERGIEDISDKLFDDTYLLYSNLNKTLLV